jgi:plasmid stabilization system protein ParE
VSIYFSPEAEADLVAVVEYLLERNPIAAEQLGMRVFEVIDLLASGQLDGPEQTLSTGERVRSWPVPPLRIYYQRRDADRFWVVRIYHQARLPLAGR